MMGGGGVICGQGPAAEGGDEGGAAPSGAEHEAEAGLVGVGGGGRISTTAGASAKSGALWLSVVGDIGNYAREKELTVQLGMVLWESRGGEGEHQGGQRGGDRVRENEAGAMQCGGGLSLALGAVMVQGFTGQEGERQGDDGHLAAFHDHLLEP